LSKKALIKRWKKEINLDGERCQKYVIYVEKRLRLVIFAVMP
jgi:hypothetical protein